MIINRGIHAQVPITSTAGSHGTISPLGTTYVLMGDTITYEITPESGYVIKRVLVDGVSVGTVSTYTFEIVNTSHTISAEFEDDTIIYSFTVLDSEDPTYGFTFHDSNMQTEEARNNLVKSHFHPCTVGLDGKVINTMSWEDMDHDINTGELVDMTVNDVFCVIDTAFYKIEPVTGGAKYSFSFTSRSPGEGYRCTCMKGGVVSKAGAGIAVFENWTDSNNMYRSFNTPNTPATYNTQAGCYDRIVEGRTGTFNQNFPPLIMFYRLMLIFVKANKNGQLAYGRGYIKKSGRTSCNISWNSKNAWIDGDPTSNNYGVTALGVHNPWGNVNEFMGEAKMGSTAREFGYAMDWADHHSINDDGIPAAWNKTTVSGGNGYVTRMGTDTYLPFLPTVASATSTTYWCDKVYGFESTERCIALSAGYYEEQEAGPFYMYMATKGYTYSDYGSRMCVLITEE